MTQLEINGLPPKRAAFVEAYTSPDSPTFGNGTKSIQAAGYSQDPLTAKTTASRVLSDATVQSAIQRAFANSGLTDTWAAERLRHFAEDSDSSWKRAPAVRATELVLRVSGALQADSVINVDARSALLPISVPPEALLELLQRAAEPE